MIKSDNWIYEKSYNDLDNYQLIYPYEYESINKNLNGEKIISYGQSSYGYDVRCSNEYKIFTNVYNVIIDPKNINNSAFVDFVGDICIIPPNSFVLTCTYEYIRMPNNVTALCMPKSTYARSGILVSSTVIEAGWEGQITIEISNTTPLPAKVYSMEGIAQLLFFEADEVCSVSYKDRGGKYQYQRGVTLPR